MYSNIFLDIDVEDRRLKKITRELTRDTRQVNSIDYLQSYPARTIAESIALANRLDALRNETRTRPSRREAEEMGRPDQERDRPLPNRYDDERRERDRDRVFERYQYADLYRVGY